MGGMGSTLGFQRDLLEGSDFDLSGVIDHGQGPRILAMNAIMSRTYAGLAPPD